jgi:hypothetical protein
MMQRHYFRAGVAGSREVANIDRSVTASGAESRASSLYVRMAMYHRNWIAGGQLVACLILPASVVNAPTGPTITRILEKRKEGDNRPDYALKGKTMAVALEAVMHGELDDMPQVRRARTKFVEWFQSTQQTLENAKLAMQAVGQGVYYDLTKFPPNVMPAALVGKGKKLTGGQTLQTTTHAFRKSPRLLGTDQEVVEEDGSVRLSVDDVEDVRQNTARGQQILELITRRRKEAAATQTGPNVTTRATRTQQTEPDPVIPTPLTRARPTQTAAPVEVRLTRSRVAQLREAAQTDDDERRRRRIARALANLA